MRAIKRGCYGDSGKDCQSSEGKRHKNNRKEKAKIMIKTRRKRHEKHETKRLQLQISRQFCVVRYNCHKRQLPKRRNQKTGHDYEPNILILKNKNEHRKLKGCVSCTYYMI